MSEIEKIVEQMNALNQERNNYLQKADAIVQELLRLDGVVRYLREKEKKDSEGVPANGASIPSE